MALLDTSVSFVALIVSILALGLSVYFWRRQFRPIVTLAVKTVSAGNVSIAYNLAVQNSGSIPAKRIRLIADTHELSRAIDDSASDDSKRKFLACFDGSTMIRMLQNGTTKVCSFGYTGREDSFWRHGAEFPVEIRYEGWFEKRYSETQLISIEDSSSFTGFTWRTTGHDT